MEVGTRYVWITPEPEQPHKLYEPGTFVCFITPKYEPNEMEWSL